MTGNETYFTHFPHVVYDILKGGRFYRSIPLNSEEFPIMHTFSREAMERPYRTIQATKVLREKAKTIERATTNA